MSGHSKWSTIKRKKGAVDAKRGAMFTRLIKEITMAAREGGGDPEGNPRLRSAIVTAKAENMPKDNIERAIKKGTGEIEGVVYDEITYEGYGPGGVAILVNSMTDNKNRTVAEIRYFFSKSGGNLGETGCVSWMFSKKGSMIVDANSVDEEKLMELALEAGAEDVIAEENEFQVLTAPDDFTSVKETLEAEGITFVQAEVSMIPTTTIEITDEKVARQLLKLMERLEEFEDVQSVSSNFDISDELMEQIS